MPGFRFEIRRLGSLVKVKLLFEDEAAAERFYQRFMGEAGTGNLDMRLTETTVKETTK